MLKISHLLRTAARKLLHKIPYVKRLADFQAHYEKCSCFAPGHFYSPLMDPTTLLPTLQKSRRERLPTEIQGIDWNLGAQQQLLQDLSHLNETLPFAAEKKSGLRYYFENGYYSYTDAIVLFFLMQHLKPKRIIEVGSGFSSALMLDTRQILGRNAVDITFIEPYPDRLHSLLLTDDYQSTQILQVPVQEVELDFFESLQANDWLFIDSSHVAKTNSDVNYLLLEVLPRLRQGVWVHFHDIFYPFEYPGDWIAKGYNWNEVYFLRAFLTFNSSYKIRLFADFIHKCHPDFYAPFPLAYKNHGGALWLEKRA